MRRQARTIAILFSLGVLWLGACQAPQRVGDHDADPVRPANDAFAARAILEGTVGSVVGSNVDAGAESGEPDHGGQPARHSVWWTWTAPLDGVATFDARASGFDARLGVYRGSALTSLVPVAPVAGSVAVAGLAAFEVAAGDVVAIAVDGLDGASGTITLHWMVGHFVGVFEPTELTFEGVVGGPAPAPAAVVVRNVGGVRAPFALASHRPWLSVAPAAGTLDPGASAEVWVAVDACDAHGSESGEIAFGAGGGGATVGVRRDCATPFEEPTLDLVLERLYVTQSVPAQDSARPPADRVPLVADRPGLLRVFVTANEANAVRPVVRLHYRHDGGPEATVELSGPDAVPLTVDEGVLGQTFHAPLGGDVLRPGLEAYVVVSLAGEADTSNNRYPAVGHWVPDVVVVPDARFTLVPVAYRGATPAVGDGSAYLGLTERMFPLAALDVEVRAPYAFTGDLDTGDGWYQLLQVLTSLRSTDGSGRHYYGVVDPDYAGGIAGIAWVGGWPVAVGWHHLPSGAAIATHELGHNWGRDHAPCGVSGDPDYPYAGGLTGVWGFDRATDQLKSPTAHADIMSYCSPEWTSDYTYRGVLDYRVAAGYAVSRLAAAATTTVLLVSGRLDGDAVVLDPLFVLEGMPERTEPGPYQLVGRAADGRELLRVAFDMVEISLEHRRAFHLAIAISADTAAALGSVGVERDGRVLTVRRTLVRPSSTSTVVPKGERDGSVTIVWDAGAFEEILVRDGVGGPVLGRDRSGRLNVRPTGPELELLLSDGVRTERRTLGF